MQLFALEEQNRKRLLLARQDTESTSLPQPSGLMHGNSGDRAAQSPSLQVGAAITPTFRPEPYTGPLEARELMAIAGPSEPSAGMSTALSDRESRSPSLEIPMANVTSSTGLVEARMRRGDHDSWSDVSIDTAMIDDEFGLPPLEILEGSDTDSDYHPPTNHHAKRGRESEEASDPEKEDVASASKRRRIVDESGSPLAQCGSSEAGGEPDIVDILLEQWTVPMYGGSS